MLLTASVECGKFFKADRGTLTLTDGQLRFESGGRCLFDVPLASIQKMVWHWYSFGGAFEATIAGQRYFLSFVPRGADLDLWYKGVSTARQWRAVLEGAPAPQGTPIAARLLLVVFQIVQIFTLSCLALLSLSAAIDPAASVVTRILGGAGAIAAGFGAGALMYQGVIAIAAALRGNRPPRNR
jgi:hypothetical protein